MILLGRTMNSVKLEVVKDCSGVRYSCKTLFKSTENVVL